MPTPNTTTNWISGGKPAPEAPEPGREAEDAIANRSRIRSMNTVPKVRETDTGALILSR